MKSPRRELTLGKIGAKHVRIKLSPDDVSLSPLPRDLLPTDVMIRDRRGKLVACLILPERTRHLPPAGMK